MKTRTFRTDCLISVLGIALVGGGYFLLKSYVRYQEQIRSAEQLTAIVDRLWEDCDLSQILMQAQITGCAIPARSVDELLSAHLATDSPRIASADPQARALVEIVTKFVDRRR